MAQRALVVGAGGAVGEAVAHALLARGWGVIAAMRKPHPDTRVRLEAAGAACETADLTDPRWKDLTVGCDCIVFTTHLALTTRALAQVESRAFIVAFSSNNVAIHAEAETYRELAAAEQALRARNPESAIVRPTLIYGDPRLATLTRVLRLAHAWPVVPMPGSGRARVQPVFHEDLGHAAAGLADAEAAGVYAVGGPDIVTMRELFETARRVAAGGGVIAPLPGWVLSALSWAGAYSAEQAARVDWDRLAVPQTTLPDALAPRVRLQAGLTRHWAAMRR